MSINSPLRERIFSYSLSLSFSLSISCGTTRRVKFLFLPKFPRFVRREFFNGRTDGIFVFELSGAGKPRERCSRAYYPPTLERTPFVFHPLSPGPSPTSSTPRDPPRAPLRPSQFNRREVEMPQRQHIGESFLDAFKYLLKAIVHEIGPAG